VAAKSALAEPQARVCGCHRLANRADEISAQGVQIDLVPQLVGERVESARGVIARAIEPPVDRALYAASDRLEERERDEGGRRDR
jgi:hypothetical protein